MAGGLKLVVIVLALMIAAVLAAIIWRMVELAGGGRKQGFGDVKLDLPPGCRVVDANAGDGRLVLRVGEGAACDRVLLVDPASGRVLGTILP